MLGPGPVDRGSRLAATLRRRHSADAPRRVPRLRVPNKLSEFIITGKPVLVSRLKTMRRYFSEGALAFFEPNKSDALARQMVRLYRDRTVRGRSRRTRSWNTRHSAGT